MIFEERLHDQAARTRQWHIDRRVAIALGRDETLRHLEHARIGCESARRKACSQHAVGRRATGMERLRHGAKHRFQPGRLGAGKTKRNLRLIEIEQEPGRGGRTERASMLKRQIAKLEEDHDIRVLMAA